MARGRGCPSFSVLHLDRIIEERRHEPWVINRGRSERDGWSVAHVGLGRDLCGQTVALLAERLRMSETKVRRLYAMHRQEMQEETAYSLGVVQLAGRGFEQWAETSARDHCGVRR